MLTKSWILILCLWCLTSGSTFSQTPVEVVNKTFKLGVGGEEFYYGFAEGDEIEFDFVVRDGKPAKEIEVIELPNTEKFMEFKVKEVTGQRIHVPRQAIYCFRYKNGGLGKKVCKVGIKRIPASAETQNFNTSVVWKTRYDTTWVKKIRYDLVSVDTTVLQVADRKERVHSKTHLQNPNTSSFKIELPYDKKTNLKTQKVISWAFWIGVGNEGAAAYEKARKEFLVKNAVAAAKYAHPLAALAVGAHTLLVKQPDGDNIHFSIRQYYNDNTEYTVASGNSVVASGREERKRQGPFFVRLENDNLANGINVNVKVTAVQEIRVFKEVEFEEPELEEVRYPDFGDQ